LSKRRGYGWNKQGRERMAQGLCPVCGKPQSEWPEKRLKYTICSRACGKRIHEAYDDWSRTRRQIVDRDRVCSKCGGYPISEQDIPAIDPDGLGVTLEGALASFNYRGSYHYLRARLIWKPTKHWCRIYYQGSRVSLLAKTYSLSALENGNSSPVGVFHIRDDFPLCDTIERERFPFWRIEYEDRDKFIVDHIQPIEMDGEEFDTDNCQLLCDWCHAWKTSRDITYIAGYRKIKNPELRKEFVKTYLKYWGKNFACPPRGMTIKDKTWLKQQEGRIMAFHKNQQALSNFA